MTVVYTIFGILIILYSCFLLYKHKQLKKLEQQLVKNENTKINLEYQNHIQKLEEIFNKKQKQLELEYDNQKKYYEKEIENIKTILQLEQDKTDSIISARKKNIDLELQNYKDMNVLLAEREYEQLKQQFDSKLQKYVQNINSQKEDCEKQISTILQELENYKQQRTAINEAIIREREINEKEEFYKLQMSSLDIEDINFIKTIRDKIRNKEILDKTIYETYYRKSLTELVKRVTMGKSISGIYKITYIPTGEVYIGKSTNIGERWKQHIKSSLNIGTIAHSSLHTYMEKNGAWNFTFEIIEEVSKENLTEREKWYINFYESDKYGLNQKIG